MPNGWIPASIFWLINQNKIIGVLSIRHELTKYLEFRGGHISYYIRPSERKKGYATKMLSLGLKECEKLVLTSVLITCAKSNIGSMKTILNNGGKFDSEDI